MAIPAPFKQQTTPVNYDYAFNPTTGVDFPSGTARALWVSHNAATTITVITDNGDSVVIGVNGCGLVPLRVKQVSANANAAAVAALY